MCNDINIIHLCQYDKKPFYWSMPEDDASVWAEFCQHRVSVKSDWAVTGRSLSLNWFGVFAPVLDLNLDCIIAMEPKQQGLLDQEPLKEEDEDMESEVDLNNMLTDEEREEMLNELTKLEEEIATLKQVLASKEKRHWDLREKLGITPLGELRHNFSKNWNDMQSSTAYKKTSETLTTAGQKTSAAFSNLGTAISRKFGDMSYSIRHSMSMPAMRNSPSFRSFEEKVESTVSNIKTKVGGTGGAGSFEEVLSSAAHASAQNTPTNNVTDSSQHTC